MKITKEDLRRIIIEEYVKEEGYDIDEGQSVEDLLKQIMGDKYRPPEEREPARYAKHDGETIAMEKPHDHPPDDEEPEIGGPIQAISTIIKGMPASDVEILFQAVFETIPGVEMGGASPETPKEEPPETLYVKGAEGRSAVGFAPRSLEEIEKLIHEVMMETEWHDIFAGETAPLHSTGDVKRKDITAPEMSDTEIIDAAEASGIETFRYLDRPGEFIDDEARDSLRAELDKQDV